jgi:TRAP-type C4-dicarboxylate transport system substrate-binding protein
VKVWKLILCLVLLVVLVAVVACGTNEESASTTVAPATTTTTQAPATTAPPTTAIQETTTAPASTDTTLGPGESVTLNWASGLQSTSAVYTDFVIPWSKWVEAKTNGRLRFNFQVDSTVLPPPQILDGVANGVADMGDLFMGLYPGRFPLCDVAMLPFIYTYPTARDAGATITALAQKYPGMGDEFTSAGVKLLGFMPLGAGQIQTTKKQVKTMADLKGMILEAHSGDYVNQALKLLGATPEQIDPSEGFDSLAKGVVQGTIGEYEFIVSAGFNKVINYTTEVGGLGQGMEAIVINPDAWNKIPADIQAFLSGEAMQAFTDAMGYFEDQADQKDRTILDQQYKDAGTGGVYVLPADELATWMTTIQPVYQSWIDAATKSGADGAAMYADAQAFAKQFAYGTYSTDYPETLMTQWAAMQ